MLLDYGSLQFVDQVGNNFLFRGGSPVQSEQYAQSIFDYDGLKQALQKVHPATPNNYYLVDVSLLYDDTGNDGQELATERRFFSANPAAGQLLSWPIWGTPRCYFTIGKTDPTQRDRLLKTLEDWLPDDLIRRTEALRNMLESSWAPGPTPFDPQNNPPPCVFYVHCDGGCDRTAEIIGAYRLRYMGYAWSKMWSEQPCGRPLGCNNYRALQWYAYWLNQTLGFNVTDVGIDGGCSDPKGIWHACSQLLTSV